MIMLAGVDVSGSKPVGNHKFMGIVIGTQESIRCIVKNLESNQNHMNAVMDKKKQDTILSRLRFNGNENIAFCVRLDKDTIVKKISTRKKYGHRYPRKNIFRAYDYLSYKYMYERIATFLARHNHALSDVVFQCDSDCRDFIKVNGLRHDNAGNAYRLADIVAWSNNKNKEPRGVKSLDPRAWMDAELKKRFK